MLRQSYKEAGVLPHAFTIITLLLAFFLASISVPAHAQVPVGSNATAVSYDEQNIKNFGRFRYQSPGIWKETTIDGSVDREYIETGRTSTSIFLYDTVRDLRLQLDFSRNMIAISSQGSAYTDYKKFGSRATLINGTRPRAPTALIKQKVPTVSQPVARPATNVPTRIPPSRASTAFQPGKIWLVQMRQADGQYADVIWKFNAGSDQVDAVMYVGGKHYEDVLTYEGFRNGSVSFYSSLLKARFSGVPSAGGNHIIDGTLTGANAGPGDSWSASIWRN